jgi:predicted anti-sigma-YlaC factor YlaD
MTDHDPTADRDPARPGCEPGQSALQRLLDGEPAWDTPEAVAHRAACADCRDELTLARTFAGMNTQAVTVPTELTGRWVASAVSAHRRRQFVRYAGVGVALAASVLVVVFVFGPPKQTITETRTVAIAPPPKPDAAPIRPLGESMSEARDAIVQLTRRAAAETRDTPAGLIPGPTLTKDVPDPAEGLEPLSEARTGAAKSVEPLRNSARRAVNLFLRAAEPPNRPAVQ